jgi:aminopeptidase N
VNAKAFQVAFEKTLAKSARLTADDVALLEKRARALKKPMEKQAADEVLALIRHDRILDESQVEPARQALCKLLGVSSQRLPAALERALAHAVPVPNVRVADYDLAFDFSRDAESFPAKAAITLEAPAPKRSVLEVDPDRLAIDDVKAGGRRVPFVVKDGRLLVDAPGANKLHILYRVTPTDDVHGYGLIRDRYAGRMWTLTWPYNSGALFPSSSRPDDGATARVTVKVQVKEGEEVVAAGRQRGDGAFHIPQPVPAHAIGFTTGDVTDMRSTTRGGYEARTVGLGSAVPSATRIAAREAVAAAMKFASSWLGSYPFGKTLNIVEIKSEYGGMEHVGAIAVGVGQSKADTVEAAVHETMHSWWGDGVFIEHWGELWMSEGFTNYTTFRFFEKHESLKKFHQLLDDAKNTLREQVDVDAHSTPLADHAHVDPQAGLSWVPYMHGVWMLRMLEVAHGRPVIDALIRDWYQAKRGTSVTTEEFIAFAKHKHGLELRPFFAQWHQLESIPTVEDKSRIDGTRVTLSLKAKGTIPTMQVPVLIEGTRGEKMRAVVTPGQPTEVDAGFSVKALSWDPDRTVLVDVV